MFILREECRLRVWAYEGRGKRGIQKTVYTQQGAVRSVLLAKYLSGDKIKKNEMARHVACMGDRKGAYKIMVGKPEGRKPLARPRHRWEVIIKMGF